MGRAGLLSDETRLGASVTRSQAHTRIKNLFDAHFDFVWQLLRRFGLSRSDADDGVQQVFMILSRRLESIEPGSERAFLYGTTRRVFANTRRGFRRRREVDEEALEQQADASLPDELLERARGLVFLDRLLSELPETLRRVLVLAEIEQQSTPDIAALEGIPLGTAASRLRRAREAFRELLAKAHEKDPSDGASE